MTLKEQDFTDYDAYKNIQGSNRILNRIKETKTMLPNIIYWDNVSNNIMTDVDLDKFDVNTFNSYIENIKKVHDTFKKGYIDSEEMRDKKTFDLLMEHLTLSAYRYNLIYRKPFILVHIKYNLLTPEEIKCVFEYIIHTDLYLNSVRHNDTICFVKLGWWTLKDVINKYKSILKVGISDYNYEGDYKW